MKLRYILIVGLLALLFGIYMIGQNAAGSQDLAGKLFSLDNTNQSTVSAQKALADYVHAHMGASTAIFLGSSYQRAVAASGASPATSGQVYHDAQVACYSKTSAVNQANCVQSYVDAHSTPGATNLQPAQVDKSAYTFGYTSPRWTPDLAGILLLVGFITLLAGGLLWLTHRFKL